LQTIWDNDYLSEWFLKITAFTSKVIPTLLLLKVVATEGEGGQGNTAKTGRRDMPNIAVAFKEEISRIARREVRKHTEALRKASVEHRKSIAEMRRQLSELKGTLTVIQKQVPKDVPAQATEADAEGLRFSAKGLRSSRKRLRLSAAEYGKLIGVTAQTIYNWERETARPRGQQLAGFAAVRRMGKKEAWARLEQLDKGIRKKS
jgi:DNA-binding transcriptional regulator YiaG